MFLEYAVAWDQYFAIIRKNIVYLYIFIVGQIKDLCNMLMDNMLVASLLQVISMQYSKS